MRIQVFAIIFLLSLQLQSPQTVTVAAPSSPDRLSVAVFWFENKTNDPSLAHWCYTVPRMLTRQLRNVHTLRLLPSTAIEVAFHLSKHDPSSALTPADVRTMGATISARRVIWGSYTRTGQEWVVTVRIMNVGSGAVSPEIDARSANWQDLRDMLGERILKELSIAATAEERQKMARRFTQSPIALEWFSKATAAALQQKPLSEVEAFARKAVSLDSHLEDASLILSSVLMNQGKMDEAKQGASMVLTLNPENAPAHVFLGFILEQENKPDEAKKEYQHAHRLDPDDPESLHHLGELVQSQGKIDEAMSYFRDASQLDPTSADLHAHLALGFAMTGKREKAAQELREAERLQLQRFGELMLISQYHDMIGESSAAIQSYERLVERGRTRGYNADVLRFVEARIDQLKASLSPSFIHAPPPKKYTAQALESELLRRLGKDQIKVVTNPLSSSANMKRWAQQLTKGTSTDLQKAKALFDALQRRVQGPDPGGTRTAQEVFDAWRDPRESFSCQEFAKLFIALARDVGVDSFYVHLERDNSGKIVYHDCAAVFADGKSLLVDPAYRWFGVPHQSYIILDDIQAIAHHLFQPAGSDADRNLRRCKVAAILHPDIAWGQLALANAHLDKLAIDDAENALAKANKLEADRWDYYLLKGSICQIRGKIDEAMSAHKKAVELNPENATVHFYLAQFLLLRGKLADARNEFQTCLRCVPEREMADEASRAIAEINERIGEETPASAGA